MRKAIAAWIVGMSLVVGGVAMAQDGADEEETKFYDFNDMLIDGEFQKPSGMFATERGSARFDALLTLRRSFMGEIEEAAHEDVLE